MTENTGSDVAGPRLIDVLRLAWTEPFALQSDFARAHADIVAMAASDGLITTKIASGLYGRRWLITEAGLRHLRITGEIGGEDQR